MEWFRATVKFETTLMVIEVQSDSLWNARAVLQRAMPDALIAEIEPCTAEDK